MIRTLAVAGLSLLVLAACSPEGAKPAASNDPAAGLGAEIGAWHKDLEAGHTACASKVD